MIFFDDIIIPSDKLPEPSRFLEKDQIWVWDYQTTDESDGSVSSAELFMEPGSDVRFKVVAERFVETRPVDGTAPPEVALPGLQDAALTAAQKQAAYQIIGSMSESGLGCLQWWNS